MNPHNWTSVPHPSAPAAKPPPTYPACNTHYRAFHESGTRPASAIRYIVLHSTESAADSAKEIAQYFTTAGAGGSAHLVIDTTSCYRCLDDNEIPWGAPPLNTNGYHIEHCGYASWSAAEWAKVKTTTLARSAYKAALRCKAHHIPARVLTDKQLEAGSMTGIVTHAQVSRVFHRSDHTDPGSGFPLAWYVNRVGLYLPPAV
jgi:hypothetical protein